MSITGLRFNPLTGISSILTLTLLALLLTPVGAFQSPDGDFVYSDWVRFRPGSGPTCTFQSPDGDFVYSDSTCAT